jgi:hypothetical protein
VVGGQPKQDRGNEGGEYIYYFFTKFDLSNIR